MDDYALVVNAGSSRLKFCVYRRPDVEDWRLESRGQIEGVGTSLRISARDAAGGILVDHETLAAWLRYMYADARVVGVGHRVVHGGARHAYPTVVTPQTLAELYRLVSLAPLHQPCNLAAIEAVAQRFPHVPQVACFDISFHRSRLPVAKVIPLPREICNSKVQRYGFHGLSYEYVASVLLCGGVGPNSTTPCRSSWRARASLSEFSRAASHRTRQT